VFNYVRSKQVADKLISKFGQDAILRRRIGSGTDYDPTLGAAQDHKVKIAVTTYSDYEITQGRVRSSDKRVMMAKGNLTIDPAENDKLVIGGVEHVIVGPNEGRGIIILAPGGTVIMYELQCRR